MATVLAGPRIGEHVACQRGQSKCVVKFAIAQLITNKPVTLTGYLRFPVAAGLFRSNVEHAKRLWFTRDHLAMAQALGWDRVASFYIDLEAPVLPSGMPLTCEYVLSSPRWGVVKSLRYYRRGPVVLVRT